MAVFCDEGCTCGRHRRKGCAPGCTCGLHKPPWNAYTEAEREAALERRRTRNREYTRRRRADPNFVEVRATPEQQRAYSMKHRHGLTPETWSDLLSAQDGRCYLCTEPLDTESRTGVHVDHDHACCRGKRSCGSCIRGLACQKCNQGIGQFGDDPDRMRLVADNLEMANKSVRSDPSRHRPAVMPWPVVI